MLDKVILERLARDELNDPPQDVGGVAVVPLGARIEQQREGGEGFAGLFEIARCAPVEAVGPVQRIDLIGEVEVVGQARCVGHQAVDADLVRRLPGLVLHHVAAGEHACVRERRNPARDRIGELEQALLVELHRGNRHDGLGHRVDAVDRVGGDWQRPLAVALAVAVRIRDLAATRQQHRHARKAPVVDIAIQVCCDALQPAGVEPRFGRFDFRLDRFHRCLRRRCAATSQARAQAHSRRVASRHAQTSSAARSIWAFSSALYNSITEQLLDL